MEHQPTEHRPTEHRPTEHRPAEHQPAEHQPLRVLVVDDELPLLQELRSYPWETFGAVLVGEAENGEEALALCRNRAPDVVVTDITMPLMDGLTLFREIKLRHPETQVILLTCHSDFAYAREALRLGALEYLVKVTLDEADMGRALDKARQALEKERSYRRQASRERRREQALGLAALLKGQPDMAATADLGPFARISAEEPAALTFPMRFACLQVDAAPDDLLFVREDLQELLEPLEAQHGFTGLWVGESACVLLPPPGLAEARLRSKLEAALGRLRELVETRLTFYSREVRLSVILSEPVDDCAALAAAWRTAKLWRLARFYEAEGTGKAAADEHAGGEGAAARGGPATPTVPRASLYTGRPLPFARRTDRIDADFRALMQPAAASSSARAALLREALPRWCARQRLLPDDLRSLVAEWYVAHASEPLRASAGDTARRILAAETLSGLVSVLVHAFEREAGTPETSGRREVRETILYIREHLADPLTVTLLARHVGLSSRYLSRLFREESGESINEHITRLRMQQALRLLSTTNLKVYEIAERVGIPSYRYFTALFREHYGMAPTDCRGG
ncbi:two-component system response regulator [Paenibacillus sp. 32O-W]|nr:two-component system response regulator [Paenibacillus sp. 32O-W]